MGSILLETGPKRNGEPLSSGSTDPSQKSGYNRDPYRVVIIFLLSLALLGTAGAIFAGITFSNPVLLIVAVTLGLAAGVLTGVAVAQAARAKPRKVDTKSPSTMPASDTEAPEHFEVASDGDGFKPSFRPKELAVELWEGAKGLRNFEMVRIVAGALGVIAIGLLFQFSVPLVPPTQLVAAIIAPLCLVAAGLAATAVHYLDGIEPARLAEAPGLCRGARVVAWILVVAAVSVGLAWADQQTAVQVLYFVILAINAVFCFELLRVKWHPDEVSETFWLDLGVLSALGSRTNILGSVLDTAERQLGIDLRSTWALTVVRRSLEPLIIGLFFIAWLSTSLTVVGVSEEGRVERLGVPVAGQSLMPGLHLHWPWPVDRVFLIPVQRVQSLPVGHPEGAEKEGGPENVLWAVEHAPDEYTLVLGNGRDLVTIDADVQYRITDARAWLYNSQNPAVALKAVAYHAVMRDTVDRTLIYALSENKVAMTSQIRDMIQKDADAMGLGVQILSFTFGGMHPPVPVAPDYEHVVSAEIGKVTAVVTAQAYRNETVPAAEASVVVDENTARAEGAESLGRAAGEAWSFRTLESQYRAAPQEYIFRRRLETLEAGLGGRRFTVVDSRFERDGGELWVIP